VQPTPADAPDVPPDPDRLDPLDPLDEAEIAAIDAVFNLPSRPVRVVLLAIGTVALVLGVVALVIPLIPSTPFLLIAAACYARASERLYRWLLAQPAIGRIIVEWRTSRTIAPDVKRSALLSIVLTFAVSTVVIDVLAARVVLVTVGVLVFLIVWRLPESRPPA
jgi:uncharacterized membrane protein YbaN (DUF454 family)